MQPHQDFVMVPITKIVVETKTLAHLPNEMSETPFAFIQPASGSRLQGSELNYIQLLNGSPTRSLCIISTDLASCSDLLVGDK